MGIKSTVSRAKPELQKIRDYQLITQLTNKNSGNGLWAFAVKDGREYFIKQFLSPVCPREGCGIPEDIIARKRKEGEKFYQKMTRLYYAVNKSATGNIVTIDAFFFDDTKYYIATQRIDTANLEMKQIASKENEVKTVLMKVIAHSLASLHANGVVHADLKPSNILIKETTSGNGKSKSLTAKLIDFDSSYLEREREKDDRIEGDVVYLAPETLLADQGEDIKLTAKVDVFALGLLFHQYYTGDLPRFSSDYSYAHQAVLDGRTLFLDTRLPADLKDLIASMLERDPVKRPTTQEVFETLQGKRNMTKKVHVDKTEDATEKIKEKDTSSVWHRPRSLS
ncbi:MAG TPA: protein kinase [Negativicutes bacterium]|nr:protein kinase [Negativicutes bacterium]